MERCEFGLLKLNYLINNYYFNDCKKFGYENNNNKKESHPVSVIANLGFLQVLVSTQMHLINGFSVP